MPGRGKALLVLLGVCGGAILGPPGIAPAAEVTLQAGPTGALPTTPWKGAETLVPIAVGPNVDRCGAPPNVEARYAGTGIDTNGGTFAVTASGCLNLDTLRVFDMEATDTYAGTGDAIHIAPADFTLVIDPATCVATNADPVPFRVDGGTGRYELSTGSGTFDFALNHPQCNGLAQPAHIWFRGEVHH